MGQETERIKYGDYNKLGGQVHSLPRSMVAEDRHRGDMEWSWPVWDQCDPTAARLSWRPNP